MKTNFVVCYMYFLLILFQLTLYAGYAVMAFLASFAISLAFEAPIVRLLKIMNGGTRRK